MKYFLFLLFIVPFTAFSQTDTLSKPEQEKAFAVAKLWVQKLTEGEDIDGLMNITTVPFLRDGSERIKNFEDVKRFYLSVIEDKGKRTLPELTVTFSDAGKVREAFKGNLVVVVMLEYKGREVGVLVSLEKTVEGEYVVNGFED